jgi:hypothetical protein
MSARELNLGSQTDAKGRYYWATLRPGRPDTPIELGSSSGSFDSGASQMPLKKVLDEVWREHAAQSGCGWLVSLAEEEQARGVVFTPEEIRRWWEETRRQQEEASRRSPASVFPIEDRKREFFVSRWERWFPLLQTDDGPYQWELRADGLFVGRRRSRARQRVIRAVRRHFEKRGHDGVLGVCPVLTVEGIRVPDIAWSHAGSPPLTMGPKPRLQAPDIWVEIVPGEIVEEEDEERIFAGRQHLFFAGVREFWLVDESGSLSTFDAQGRMEAIGIFPDVTFFRVRKRA